MTHIIIVKCKTNTVSSSRSGGSACPEHLYCVGTSNFGGSINATNYKLIQLSVASVTLTLDYYVR